MHLFLVASCQDKKNNMSNCEEIITSFNYPADIELLENKKYVCDSVVLDEFNIKYQPNDLKMYEGFKILFSDKNYTLTEYDLRTRLLNDKRENIWLVFKAGEVGNFYFNNPNYENIYGLSNIYILDDNLMPMYSFNKSGLKKYRLNDKKEITESEEIILKNQQISHNIDTIDYNGIIKIVRELKDNKYTESKNWKEEYYYKNPPVWSDL